MKAVSFTTKDCDRVMVAVREIGEHVVVEGTLTTDDPFVIAALDAHPNVERGKAPKTPAVEQAAPKTPAVEQAAEPTNEGEA